VSARQRQPADTPPLRGVPLRGTVLFVHGLWLSGAESFLIRRRLAAQGWNLRVLPYSSLAETMDGVARRCARFAHALARRTLQPVHLVGHSLGGLVIYRMFELGLLEPDRFSNDFCRVVFLGTPVRGSRIARALARNPAAARLLGGVGMQWLPDGIAGAWSFPAQLGTIAGTAGVGLGRLLTVFDEPNDGTVTVAETRLEGAADHCELPVSHTGMWLSADVVRHVVRFLESGRF
jgi:pimeloyl-ACP methyl ester carboxylesterase